MVGFGLFTAFDKYVDSTAIEEIIGGVFKIITFGDLAVVPFEYPSLGITSKYHSSSTLVTEAGIILAN